MIIRLNRAGGPEQLRLFCFPYAGGTAASYRSWANHAPDGLGLYSFEIPGRGARFNEPALVSMEALVSALADALTPYSSLPFVFFGHSLGGRVAFALAEKLRSQERPLPLLLAVSASFPPDRRPELDVSAMSDSDFRSYLADLGGTPPDALADRELMELLTPMLRTDFNLACELVPPSKLLGCPILAFGGVEDLEVTRTDLEAWRAATRGPFWLDMVPGGHFFLSGSERLIIARIMAVCQSVLASKA